jgi:hypothetical protein
MHSFKKIIAIAFFLVVSITGFSQPGGNPGGGVKPGVPITGIEILIALGGIVGIKKIFDSRKSK